MLVPGVRPSLALLRRLGLALSNRLIPPLLVGGLGLLPSGGVSLGAGGLVLLLTAELGRLVAGMRLVALGGLSLRLLLLTGLVRGLKACI